MIKLLSSGLVLSLGFLSCTPVGSYQSHPTSGTNTRDQIGRITSPSHPTATPTTVNDQRVLREQQRTAQQQEQLRNPHPTPLQNTSPPTYQSDPPSQEVAYRYGMLVPGRKGWVYNPYTNSPVDARGVDSGRLIYDETDPANQNPDGTLKSVSEMPHKFRVP